MRKPTRIAHVIGHAVGGGVESVVINYYRNIDRTQYQFDFFIDTESTIDFKSLVEPLGARVYVVPSYRDVKGYVDELTRIFRENRYKIVHSHMNTLSVFTLYAAKQAEVPIRIAHNHSTAGKGETKKNIMKYILRPFAKVNATHYAACSRYAGEWLFGKNAVKRGEVTIFNNAIDLAKFSFNRALRDKVRKELGIENKFVIGHVGRFCYQKNHDFLLDVFKAVHDKVEDAVLMLVGDGELMESVKAKVHFLDLNKSVLFLGNRSDVARLYQAMDVFVLPSRYEGLPVVGVEAQAAGVPCVFSTAMTKETKIMNNVTMVGLRDSVEEWSDTILRISKIKSADDSDAMLGFNIACVANKLTKYYNQLTA